MKVELNDTHPGQSITNSLSKVLIVLHSRLVVDDDISGACSNKAGFCVTCALTRHDPPTPPMRSFPLTMHLHTISRKLLNPLILSKSA